MIARKPFAGVLRRRMPSAVTTPIDKWCLALHERIVALAEHYCLDWRKPGIWETLLAVGPDLVPCFEENKGVGGKPVDGKQTARDIILFMAIREARHSGKNDASVYRRLAKKWGVSPDYLRVRFNRDLLKPTSASYRMWRMVVLLAEDEKKE